MTNKIVPFGKYKGQPIEALAQDQKYVDWLLAQDWFRERHEGMFTLVVNNFAEPSETPAHNAMQARFLDHAFVDAFCHTLDPRIDRELSEAGHPIETTVKFEPRGFDVKIDRGWRRILVEIKPSIGDDYPAVLRQMQNGMRGYPGETRSAHFVLFAGEYRGAGATQEQFVQIFAASGIKVVIDTDRSD
jgi:hypothetical protein